MTSIVLNNDRPSSSRRFISSSRRKGKNEKYDKEPLKNEHLIAALLTGHTPRSNKSSSSSVANVTADSFEVRLLIDRGRNTSLEDSDTGNDETIPSTDTAVVPLSQAIERAGRLSLDLVEISLSQNPPVIKAVNFEKWLYDSKKARNSKKKAKGTLSESSKGQKKQMKEFKFRAGIADHDLKRKAADMMKYLSKGHPIRVVLTAPSRTLREDKNAIESTLSRVKEIVGEEDVVVSKPMKSNERGNFGSLVLQPGKGLK